MSTSPSVLGRPVGAIGEETRKRIIEATMRCVAEMGYSGATIREIARAAQMTSGSVYHYFSNKAELITETVALLASTTVPRLAAAAQRADTVVGKLIALFEELEKFGREYPYAAAFDRAIRAESAQHLHLAENSETKFTALRDLIGEIIAQAEREGTLARDVDVEGATNAVYSLFLGVNQFAASGPIRSYHATMHALKLLISGQLFTYGIVD